MLFAKSVTYVMSLAINFVFILYDFTLFSSDSFKLTSEEKKIIGLQCKRLIDTGRMKYLEQYGYSTELMYYVDSDVTLEDVVLLAKKR